VDHSNFIEGLFRIQDASEFEALALELFRHQAEHNNVYATYLDMLKIQVESIHEFEDIPFLPIEFFKSHQVVTGSWEPEAVFHSSGTSRGVVSKHQIKELSVYRNSFTSGFKAAYGEPESYIILCLLPNYADNPNSSLIYMTDELIELSGQELSGYYLNQDDDLHKALKAGLKTDKKVLLLGVSYALLDLAKRRDLPDMEKVIVMETGGMKGNRKEMVKEELHGALKRGLGVGEIHSEYGMTELLSQAYSTGDGIFTCPPWMRITARDVNDPLKQIGLGRSGGINIIDLANMHSCAFIATQDLGKVYADGSFELLGRFDHSDIRGCNLLLAEG
jgi:hypothetical protein